MHDLHALCHCGRAFRTRVIRVCAALRHGLPVCLGALRERLWRLLRLLADEPLDDAALDGFHTPSARNLGGTCTPVLRRASVSSMELTRYVRFDYSEQDARWIAVLL